MATEKPNPLDSVYEAGEEEAKIVASNPRTIKPKSGENHKVEFVTAEEFTHRNDDNYGRYQQLTNQFETLNVAMAAMRGLVAAALALAIISYLAARKNKKALDAHIKGLEPAVTKLEVVEGGEE